MGGKLSLHYFQLVRCINSNGIFNRQVVRLQTKLIIGFIEIEPTLDSD